MLVYVAADDCVERSHPVGTAFVDPGHGHVHTAYNATGAPTPLVATFFEAPQAPAPRLIPGGRPPTTAKCESPPPDAERC